MTGVLSPPVAVVAGIATAVVTAALIPVLSAVAASRGLASRPGPLNPEPTPVPVTGGPALLAGSLPVLVVAGPALLVALVPALLLGLVDDLVGLRAGTRLAGWSAIGLLVAAVSPVGGAAVVVTAVATVAVCCGCNFLDGIDGLAGGVVAVSAVGLALASGASRTVAVPLACGLLGFLWWNRHPARCYLGNSGASLAGVWLTAAVVAAHGAPGGVPGRGHGLAPVVAVGVLSLAVPGTEVGATVVRRLRAGHGLALRERGHGYDQLVARGVPVARAGLVYVAVQAVASGSAVAVARGRIPLAPALAGSFLAVAALVAGTGALHPARSPGSGAPGPG